MFRNRRPWHNRQRTQSDGDTLWVRGQDTAASKAGDDSPSADVLGAYSRFAQSSKPLPGQLRGGRLVPHVQFANSTGEELLDFVRRYGPVNGKLNAPGPLAKDSTTIEVAESLPGLRRWQQIFSSLLKLMNGLRESSDMDTANALGDLMQAWSLDVLPGDLEVNFPLDLFVRAKRDGLRGNTHALESFLRNLKGGLAQEYGWYVLCVLLNAFPPVIVPVKNGLMEMPPQTKAGILPALFFLLRRDILLDNEIRMCEQRDCGKFFKVDR